jgi:hypothetical protein
MDRIESKGIEGRGFQELGASELDIYVGRRADDVNLLIPDANRPSVLDNLAALQAHAAILSRALGDRGAPTTRTPAS